MAETKTARQWLEEARNFDPDTIEQAPILGETFKLTEASAYARRTLAIYAMINPDALEELPPHVRDQLAERLKANFDHFAECLKFKAGTPEAPNIRNHLQNRSKELFDNSWSEHALLAASARFDQVNLNRQLSEALAEHNRQVEELMDALAKQSLETGNKNAAILSQAEEALDAARDASAAAGVQFQANKFQQASEEHKKLAKDWLGVLIGLSLILAGWAFVGAWAFKAMEYVTGTPLDAAQMIASKVLVFGVLSFAAIIASRSYFAHCHNTVVNLHRQNALQTYKAIVEATGDAGSRDVVLKHAAACIFAPQSSGYSKESNGKPSSVNVIETIGSHLSGKQDF